MVKIDNKIERMIKIKKASKGKDAKIEKLNFIDFKKVKALEFSQLNHKNWHNLYDLLSPYNISEAKLDYEFDWGFIEYCFIKKYKKIPFVYQLDSDIYDNSFITDLFNFLNPPFNSCRIKKEFTEKGLKIKDFALLLEEEFIIHYDGRIISIFISNDYLKEKENNLFNNFLGVIVPYIKLKHQENKIHVVFKDEYGFDKKGFNIKNINVNINLNYNDDFKDTSQYIIDNLNDKKKTGLYVLEGEPGTGKTTFIRHLASKIKRNIIFISPDMVDHITDPSFIPFLMNNSDSVLIIEDAEPALQKRDGSSRTSAISNILNLTDGLLSDCLNISIVATFNTNTKDLDDALLRGGRLIKSYTFKKLVKEKATKLLKKLGHDVEAKEDLTLAEIYFYGKNNNADSFKNKKIGFGN